MVTLTYKELEAIGSALFGTIIETPQIGGKPYERAFKKIIAAMNEAEGIEPKPKFKLTRESE